MTTIDDRRSGAYDQRILGKGDANMEDRTEFRYYRETNPYAHRPKVGIARPFLHEMLDGAITDAYSTGSIGAKVTECLPDYEVTVSFTIKRLGGPR